MADKAKLLADIEALDEANTAHATARQATLAAKNNTVAVTAAEQALVDAANSHFDSATAAARQAEADRQAEESAASGVERAALATLLADAQSFADEDEPAEPEEP